MFAGVDFEVLATRIYEYLQWAQITKACSEKD